MSVEGGSNGGGIGGSIAGVGVAASLGPSSGGGFSSFGIGAEITSLSSPIINESPGPVGFGFRLKEDTMAYTIDSIKIEEIVTKPKALVIRQAESIAEAALQVKQPIEEVPEVFKQGLAEVNLDPDAIEVPAGILQPNRSLYGEKIAQQAALMMVVARTAFLPLALGNPITETSLKHVTDQQPTVVTQYQIASPHVRVAEETEEPEEIEEDVYEEEKPEQEQIETIIKPIGLDVDHKALVVRESDINKAIDLVALNRTVKEGQETDKQTNKKQIDGEEIIQNLPSQSPSSRSETLNEEDPNNTILDGSREAANQKIKTLKFPNINIAKAVSFAINRKYRPEKRGPFHQITHEEHYTIHNNHSHLKRHPSQVFKERVVKLGTRWVEHVTEQKEKRIQDLPQLAEALKAV